jgi:hypothetical protein
LAFVQGNLGPGKELSLEQNVGFPYKLRTYPKAGFAPRKHLKLQNVMQEPFTADYKGRANLGILAAKRMKWLSVRSSNQQKNMNKTIISKLALLAAFSVLGSNSAFATFMIDPSPSGTLINIDGKSEKNVSSFSGHIGTEQIGFTTIGPVDHAAGVAQFNPAGKGSLTSFTLTPADGNAFGNFTMHGQLASAGNITISVQDNQGGALESFTFGPFAANANNGGIGIITVPGSGETIKYITVTGDFKEAKQLGFGDAPTTTAVPDGGNTALLLGAGIVASGFLARRKSLTA